MAEPVIRRLHDAAPMTDAEWQLRVDLAACYRLVAHFDMDDLFATHISVRAPGAADRATHCEARTRPMTHPRASPGVRNRYT